jgi:methylglutaconyl-CoA hydratase
MGEQTWYRGSRLVDLEDPAFRGKSMAQVDKEIWARDVADLKTMGVNLADNHMDGYLLKSVKEEQNMVTKPWEFKVEETDRVKAYDVDENSWKNPEFLFEIVGTVAYMTLNRPDANNALNKWIDQGMTDACRILRRRTDVRVAVLQANGRMFCAGGDPKAFQAAQGISYDVVDKNAPPPGPSIVAQAQAAENNRISAKFFAKVLYDFSVLPQYTICLIQGSCMGGGVGFASLADYSIAVKNAQFVLSEVRLGVIPATISPHVIGRIGAGTAKSWFATAAPWKAPQAMEKGMIHQVVDKKEDFYPIVKELCAQIQGIAPGSIARSKKNLAVIYNSPMSKGLMEYTVQGYVDARQGEEAVAGMKAATEKKKPHWVDNVISPKEA